MDHRPQIGVKIKNIWNHHLVLPLKLTAGNLKNHPPFGKENSSEPSKTPCEKAFKMLSFFGGRYTWMLQEASKWFVSGLQS